MYIDGEDDSIEISSDDDQVEVCEPENVSQTNCKSVPRSFHLFSAMQFYSFYKHTVL